MEVFPIKGSTNLFKPAFKGQMISYPIWHGEDYLKRTSMWHENSSIEKTLDSFHSDKRGTAYFASPMENVGDKIKETADYIVYDNEPSYPDVNEEVSKNYFGTQRKNYRKDFEAIRDYYYRREIGGFADKADAKYQQWQAAECIKMYDNAGHLRYLKETTEDSIKDLEEKVIKANKTLPEKKAELQQQEAKTTELFSKIANLSEKDAAYNKLKEIVESSADKNEEEKVFITSQISKTQRNLIKYNKELKASENKIKELKSYINGFPKMVEALKLQIKTNTQKVEEFKAKLIPLFDELKNFYAKQGIKVIKK